MPRLKVSIVFESGSHIGPARQCFSRASGSISAAAREMRMSYKRAWVLLDSMNQAFIEAVVVVAALPGGVIGKYLGSRWRPVAVLRYLLAAVLVIAGIKLIPTCRSRVYRSGPKFGVSRVVPFLREIFRSPCIPTRSDERFK
jgi:molybdate transport system regulatory protein